MAKVELWSGVSKQRQARIKRAVLKEERERLRAEIEAEIDLARMEREYLEPAKEEFREKALQQLAEHVVWAQVSEIALEARLQKARAERDAMKDRARKSWLLSALVCVSQSALAIILGSPVMVVGALGTSLLLLATLLVTSRLRDVNGDIAELSANGAEYHDFAADAEQAMLFAPETSRNDLQKKLEHFDRRRDGFVKNHGFYASPTEREHAEILRAQRVRVEPLADFDRRLAESPYRIASEESPESFPETRDSFPETPDPDPAPE